MQTPSALVLIAIFLISPITFLHTTANNEEITDTGFIVRPSGFGFYFTVGDRYAGPLKVLYLSGSDYDRGYEYGYLAAPEIDELLNWAYNVLAAAQGLPANERRQELLYMASQYEPLFKTNILR